jgi:hypothetical protein
MTTAQTHLATDIERIIHYVSIIKCPLLTHSGHVLVLLPVP